MLWGPVGLERPIDSMTCKLTPATKIDLTPIFVEPRTKSSPMCRCPFLSKSAVFGQKWREMEVSSQKLPFFGHKLSNQEMPKNTSTQVVSHACPEVLPAKLAGHGPRYTMTSCNGPLRGPNHEWPQEDVKNNHPTPWSKTIYTV